MENKTSDYSQGKIYKIVCNKTGLVYIGSTCKTLDERLKRHEDDCKRFINNYKNKPDKKTTFCSSFFVLLNKDYKIELIENYSCNTKLELEIKECEYMNIYQESVNILRNPIYHKNSFPKNENAMSSNDRIQNIKNKLGI